MTLSSRNNCFKAGIIYCVLSVLFIIAASFAALPVYSSFDMEAIRRSAGIFQGLTSRFFPPSFYAVHISISALALFSLCAQCLIFYYFEKTQVPEILFIALFIMSFAFESVRLILPLQQIYASPAFYVLIASRILLFGRYFGLFSFLAASLYAVGLEIQKQQNIIFIAAITSLAIALGTPIDAFSWNTNFNAISGYASVLGMLNAGAALITITSFLIAAYVRGSRDYVFIGIGALLAFAGRSIILNADSWAALPGFFLLFWGLWLICKYLHKEYLWL